MVGIISNSAALFAQQNLSNAAAASESSIAKLSSGSRIIKASDDVAGLAIGTSLATTTNTLKTVLGTTAQASSLLQIADGGLKNISDILSRQKALAVSANSGALSDTERAFLQQEFSALATEIDRIVDSTEFNGVKLLDGSIAASSGLKTALPAAFGDFTVSGTVGTTALSVTAAFTAGTITESNDEVIGTLADSNLDVSGVILVAHATTGTAKLTVNINGVTFNSSVVTAVAGVTTAEVITFTESGTGDMAFTVTLAAGVALVTTAQANTDSLAAAIETDLIGLKISQDRGFATSGTGSITATTVEGTALSGLTGAAFEIRGSSFTTTSLNTAPTVGSFTVVEESATKDGSISTTIGGVTYSTETSYFNDVIGLKTSTNGTASAEGTTQGAGVIRLFKNADGVTNPTEYFDLKLATITNDIDLQTAGDASALQSALNTAFGSGDAGGLTFQVGQAATDSIGISLTGASTSTIYVDADGTSVTLNIGTAGISDSSNGGDGTGSVLASNVIDRALNTVTGLRADVGALSSRFNFASANISSAIQNTDAARSNFLDVDVAEESTNFATAQVRLQASISVLAQANQLPQNLLKLIG